jgi:gas vesicle protein
MSRHQRRFDDTDFDLGGRSRSGGVGTVLLATVLGVGIGMLAAPDTGLKTRRRLRRRLSELGEGLEGGIGEIQERGGRAREVVRDRLARAKKRGAEAWEDIEERFAAEEEEEDEGSGALSTALAIAAGVAATYFLTSDRAAPARSRVRQTADTVRREATDRWQRYQSRRREADNGHTSTGTESSEPRSATIPTEEGPRAG